MKIVFDNDGTALDYNKFIEQRGYPFFEGKYGMISKNPNALEPEDIFEMEDHYLNLGYSESESVKKVKETVSDFWEGKNFVIYSLFTKFRPGYAEYLKNSIKNGHEVEIHTSRSKTTDKNFIGFIARTFTYFQYILNGVMISYKKFHFYKDDISKLDGICHSKPDLVFDDKPFILEELDKKEIKAVCVRGKHNTSINPTKNIEVINDFTENEIAKVISNIVGNSKMKLYNRISNSDKFYLKLKNLIPIILKRFNPIILNAKNIKNDCEIGSIYAPNHVKTLDPVVITGVLNINIHWAALKRFFDGTDSIFSNSKNPFLCKVTSQTFKKIEYFPIERKCDNEKANNFDSIKDMNNFLKLNQQIGIFPEGTTKKPVGKDFGEFDDSFIILAKKTNSLVRPITTLWISEYNFKNKLIINFGEPYYIDKTCSIEEEIEKFKKIQKMLLEENKEHLALLLDEEKKVLKKR